MTQQANSLPSDRIAAQYKIVPIKIANKLAIKIICDKNGVCGFYFARYMNIIFNSLLAQLVKYDVRTTRK